MKKFHKSFLLLTLAFLMVLTVVVTNVKIVYADELSFTYEYDDIDSSMESIAEFFAAKSDSSIDYYIDNSVGMQLEAFESFKDVKEQDIGSYVSVEKCNVKEDIENDCLEATSIIHFENKDVKMTAKFQDVDDDVIPVEMSFDMVSEDGKSSDSLSKKMEKATLNTIMGMGTVIIVLAFLAFLISLFGKAVNAFENRGGKNKSIKPVSEDNPESADETVYETSDETENYEELAAVIAAAIAAAEGTSANGFVVRSIKRSKNSKWKNA